MAKLAPLGAVPLGDCAVYVEFSKTLDLEVNSAVQRLATMVHGRGVPWIRDVVPALGGLAIHFDPDDASVHGDALAASLNLVSECLKEGLPKAGDVLRTIDVPVCYDASFAPGHPYIGGLHPKLSVPRRATPRATVPAGSVAVANDQTVVYPYAISGGWSIIGRTPLAVFDAERQEPSLFAAGDRVRFRPISKAQFLK